MILDNKNNNKKVYEWLNEYTEEGKMDVVTGYFTIGALAYFSQQVNKKIKNFRFVLGDIVNIDHLEDRTIDLLNENITVEAALQLSKVAQEAVNFLKQEKVEAKTLEPNFCHAKVYLFNSENDIRYSYFITGSSNLTEAGIGLKQTNNIELNIAEWSENNQYQELIKWFDDLWKGKYAHINKTIVDEKGKETKKPFKEYLIEAIEKIFIKYTPEELYYKVLFELFGDQLLTENDNPEFNQRVGQLKNTVIYKALYDFQQKGALSLIKMLRKYDGAILADAVGLGKTWTALAVMKFFWLEGREIILICPKKLEHNWHRYLKHQNSKFEKDQLDFFIRFHTDMHPERMEKYTDRSDKYFTDNKPKLFVIDESHNLRNSKSQRYNFLVNEILKKNENAKVLMLTATPINNTLLDIRNQFKLIQKGADDGFEETHNIKNIDYTFRTAQKAFNEWREENNPKIGDFIKKLPAAFFNLTDTLTVARTRSMIEKQKADLHFPKKQKPENIFCTPKQLGNFDSFEDLIDHFPPMLSGYQPTFYIDQEEDVDKLHDEKQRDRFLVKMLYILMVKRLESSWFSFHSTIKKILDHHQKALDKIIKYKANKKNELLKKGIEEQILFDVDELEDITDEFTLGKKRTVSLAEIDQAGNIEIFKKDLKKDIDALDLLNQNLCRFSNELESEIIQPKNLNSKDDKISSLISKINEKRKKGANNNNQKILIFTVYKDTASYIFDQLVARGFKDIAFVSGTEVKSDLSEKETKIEPILERFAPFTKLFNEKEWEFVPTSEESSKENQYSDWIEWISKNDSETYEKIKNPIDILIATDVLSEGQNLQDCDLVINYDIHWNPVRVIQRMGRIDRLGSPNKEIFGINYWPSDNINNYLNLKGRIEERMTMMKLAGSEVQTEFTNELKKMAENIDFEDKMNQRMLIQMQTSWDDIEKNEAGLGFDNLSLEDFRQDLFEKLKTEKDYYLKMPKGVFTGFKADGNSCLGSGIIALLGYPAKPPKTLIHKYDYDLIYIDMNGNQILLNQKEVLDFLSLHKNKERFVPDDIEKGDEKAIQNLVTAIKNWLSSQAVVIEKQDDGTVKNRAGTEANDILAKLRTGDKSGVKRFNQNEKATDKYQPNNFDLITWFLVK